MNDPIDRELREITQDRCGMVEDLRQIEMSAWVDEDEPARTSDEDEEDGED